MDVASKKTHIKHLFAYKPYPRSGAVDIGILTDSNKYIEYSLAFPQQCLTVWVAKKIRSLFEPYYIDALTDITSNEWLDDKHPIYLYFMLLRQHIGFRMRTASMKSIVSRVHYFYTKKSVGKSMFNKVWREVIDRGHCPWITQQVDYILQNKSYKTMLRVKTLRLAMFYMVVKNHLFQPKMRETQATMCMPTQQVEQQ